MNLDKGTDWTARCAARFGKPLLIVDARDGNAGSRIADWIERSDIHALNIAGPSENTAPGIGKKAFRIVSDVVSHELPEATDEKLHGARSVATISPASRQ